MAALSLSIKSRQVFKHNPINKLRLNASYASNTVGITKTGDILGFCKPIRSFLKNDRLLKLTAVQMPRSLIRYT